MRSILLATAAATVLAFTTSGAGAAIP